MNKPLKSHRFGKKYKNNFDSIFGKKRNGDEPYKIECPTGNGKSEMASEIFECPLVKQVETPPNDD